MMDRTINTPQVHYRGIPADHGDDNSPGSIVEHASTSMRVVLLKSNIVGDSSSESTYELFRADPHTIDKTQGRFYYVARKEMREKIHIDSYQKVKLVIPKSSTEVGESENNMQLEVWPKIFVCDSCNLIFAPDREEQRLMVDSGVFKECSCGGSFRQSPHILLCKICGSIRHMPSRCIECGGPLYLMKGSEVDVETWKLECNEGHVHDFRDYPECYACNNEDGLISSDRHRDISQGRQAGRSIIPTVGRGICSPLTLRFPVGKTHRAMQDEQKRLVACYSHTMDLRKFREITRAAPQFAEGGNIYEDEKQRLEGKGCAVEEKTLQEALLDIPADGQTLPPSRREYNEMQELSKCRVRDFDFASKCNTDDLRNRCDDWLTLMSGIPTKGATNIDELVREGALPEEYVAGIRDRLRILQVRYIESVSIVSGTYGFVRGSIHPIYKGQAVDVVKTPLNGVAHGYNRERHVQICKNDSRGLPVIVTKRETEALTFILRAKGIVNLIAKKRPDIWKAYTEGRTESSTLSELEARAWLMYACHGSKYGEDVSGYAKTIVHTVSHAVIHRFPKSSGLRDGDLGELLYPEFCGFVLYNGLEIPLGMLKRVFRDNIRRLLDDEITLEMKDCDMDPTCRQQEEGAACHACLHVPDHVCENFNADLDRKVLIDNEGYWK